MFTCAIISSASDVVSLFSTSPHFERIDKTVLVGNTPCCADASATSLLSSSYIENLNAELGIFKIFLD